MEFTQLFSALAVVLVAIMAVFGLVTVWNNEYGSTLGQDAQLNASLNNITNLLKTDFVNKGVEYGESTQPNEGQGTDTDQQDSMIKRALRSIGLIDDLVGLIPALIRDGAAALNIPSIYANIGVALFWIVFTITLAYLLIMGVRSLF